MTVASPSWVTSVENSSATDAHSTGSAGGVVFQRRPDRAPQGVSLIKSLWASVQGDPILMRRVNDWFTIFWIVMIPVSIITGWISGVAYVAALSL